MTCSNRPLNFAARGETGAKRARGDRPSAARHLAAALYAVLVLLCAGTALAQKPLGIDVSSYQGSGVNWTSVKSSGVTFAWAKATEGGSIIDPDFTINENNGKAAGVLMGAYHFAHPDDNSPGTEAAYFWSEAHGYILADGKTIAPMLDMEVFSGVVGASTYSVWVNDWCTDVVQDAANTGVATKATVYVSACNAGNFDSSVAQWISDIADYNGESAQTGTPWSACSGDDVFGGWNVWQYSSTGSVPGVSGNCDEDVFNGTSATLVSTMVAVASTNSTIYYWDPQGTTGSNPNTSSMTGTWENSKWSYGSTGLASPVAWVNGKAACFGVHTGNGTPAYTITMNSDHIVAGFFDGALAPDSCDVTISGSGVINLATGPQALDSTISSDGATGYLRIDVNIAGSGQLYPEGNGQSFLYGSNSYSGGTKLGYDDANGSNPFSGIVNFNNGSAFGTGTITLWTYGTGGALVLTGSSAATVPNAVSVISATTNNIVGNAAGLTFSGNWSIGGNTFSLGTGGTAGNQTIISGVVSGTSGLTVFNSGTLVLSGVNTYTGNTTITSPAVFTIGGAGQLNSGAYGNNIAIGGSFNYNSTASQSLSGVISGAGPLKVNNGGTLILSGVNTYSGGTQVNSASTLCITADSGLGSASAALTLNGGCLKNNNSQPTLNSGRTITLGASGGYFDAGWAPTNPVTINSKLTGSGALLINLDGSPVVLANTGNNYTGNTIIGTNGPGSYASGTAAWLKLGVSSVIPNGSGNGNVFIYAAYDGILDLAGFTQTINGLSGDGTVNNSTGSGSLTVGNNNQTSTFNGVIENTAGSLALTKTGSGTLTLGGANTYTGNTLVSAGKLALGGGSIGNSTVSVASSATLANSTTNVGPIGGSLTLASGALGSFAAAGGSPSVIGKISAGGNLTLNGNTLTINVSGAALTPGTYRLLDCSGTLSGTANATPTISGTPLGGGTTASISTTAGSAGHVDLVVQGTTPVFSNLTPSPSLVYGTSSVLLGGTVSASGPIYPTNGETVTVTINSNTQSTVINDSTGDFAINYSLTGLPASGAPYTITYNYGGDASLTGAANTATTLTLSPRPVALSGSRAYDGTTTAAAGILTVTNKVGSDVVSVASGSGTLSSANVGTNAISSFGTLALGGGAANNYTLSGASGSVIITTPPFSIIGNSIDVTGSNFVITWQSAPGATYHVIGSTNPSATLSNWPTIAGPLVATATNTSVTNPIGSATSVFDVVSP